MVAESRKWVDVAGLVRAWARDNVPSVNRRVFFQANNQAAFPQIALFRISGPDDQALIQFDVWAGDHAGAAALAAELASAADQISRYESAGAMLKGATVEGSRWEPDTESNKARYIVEVTFSAWSTT